MMIFNIYFSTSSPMVAVLKLDRQALFEHMLCVLAFVTFYRHVHTKMKMHTASWGTYTDFDFTPNSCGDDVFQDGSLHYKLLKRQAGIDWERLQHISLSGLDLELTKQERCH